MITKDINVVYKFLFETREAIGDDEFFNALTNFFNVDQLHSFAESLKKDYDLDNIE